MLTIPRCTQWSPHKKRHHREGAVKSTGSSNHQRMPITSHHDILVHLLTRVRLVAQDETLQDRDTTVVVECAQQMFATIRSGLSTKSHTVRRIRTTTKGEMHKRAPNIHVSMRKRHKQTPSTAPTAVRERDSRFLLLRQAHERKKKITICTHPQGSYTGTLQPQANNRVDKRHTVTEEKVAKSNATSHITSSHSKEPSGRKPTTWQR